MKQTRFRKKKKTFYNFQIHLNILSFGELYVTKLKNAIQFLNVIWKIKKNTL